MKLWKNISGSRLKKNRSYSRFLFGGFAVSADFLVNRPAKGLFVCGTGTDVGKTYVSCTIAKTLVAQNRSVGAYNPVASGAT